jgi:hypothetical protein
VLGSRRRQVRGVAAAPRSFLILSVENRPRPRNHQSVITAADALTRAVQLVMIANVSAAMSGLSLHGDKENSASSSNNKSGLVSGMVRSPDRLDTNCLSARFHSPHHPHFIPLATGQ